jgi:hypothetical protein
MAIVSYKVGQAFQPDDCPGVSLESQPYGTGHSQITAVPGDFPLTQRNPIWP